MDDVDVGSVVTLRTGTGPVMVVAGRDPDNWMYTVTWPHYEEHAGWSFLTQKLPVCCLRLKEAG